MVMKAHWAWIVSLVAAAGCSSSHPLDDGTGGALGPSDGAAGDRPASNAADCGPPQPLAPCRADSDCHSAYLVCAAPNVTITFCRDADAGTTADPACPSFPELADAPICPRWVQITSNVCDVRFQLPCTVDGDCGPTGFQCMSGRCNQSASMPCTTDADCPNEWACYAPCACHGGEPKVCEPPFIEIHCPNCGPLPGN
jgi:hypothetical protein